MTPEETPFPLVKGGTILVAVDESEYSERALTAALSMAEACASPVVAVTVVELYPESLEHAPDLEEKMAAEARQLLAGVRERAVQEGVECETVVHTGPHPHEYIVREAQERGVALIVTGTHGRSGLRGLFMGSVAERVVGHAPCAVLVVPSR
ncbi:MAG: universal stress protein [Gammaproteobacteria bacterium]|nr:universal stress protein [Gammaproteobacteria bacterium]